VRTYWPTQLTAEQLGAETTDELYDSVMAEATAHYEQREAELGAPVMREVERQVMLRIIDQRWREHLQEMDYLQEGINLRAMGQKDPLVEWQREGFDMFGQMMKGIAQDFVRYVMHVQVDDVGLYDRLEQQARRRRRAPRDGPRGGRRVARSPRSKARSHAIAGELDDARAAQPVHGRARRRRRHRADQREGRRRRRPGLAEMLLRMYALGRAARLRRRADDVSEGAEAGISSAEFTIKGRYAYGLLSASAGAPAGAHQPLRQPGPAPDQLRRWSRCGRAWTTWTTSRSTTRTSAWTPSARRAPAASTSTRRLRGAHHPPAHRRRGGLPGRAQPAPEPGGDEALQGMLAEPRRSARPSWRDRRQGRPRWAGAARSAPTSCSRTRW
jgi:hypothetical protein